MKPVPCFWTLDGKTGPVQKHPVVKTLVFFPHFASCILMTLTPFLIEREKVRRKQRETDRQRELQKDRHAVFQYPYFLEYTQP